MTREKVLQIVSASRAAGKDDDAIHAELAQAKAQEEQSAAPAKAPDQPGIGERIVGGLKKGLGAAESFANGFNNSFAFGLPGKALDLWDRTAGTSPLLRDMGLADVNGPENRRERASHFPDANLAGKAGGTVLTGFAGPEAALGKGAAGLMGMIEQKLPAAVQTGVPWMLAKATGTGALGGAGASAADAATNGASPREIGSSALTGGLVGGAIGGGLGAGGVIADKTANAVMDSEGGKARRLIESRGGTVGPMTSGKGGVFDNELAGLKANDRGIGEAGRRAAGTVLSDTESKFYKDTAAPHSANRAAIAASPEGQATRDITPIYSQLVGLERSKRLTPSERGLVGQVLKDLDKHVSENGVMMTEEQINDFRGMLGDLSGRGSPGEPSVAQSKLDKVTGATKGMVDEGPYAKTNAMFAAGKSKLERQRNILDLPENPSTSLDPARSAPEGGRENEVAKVANFLARDEQNTITGGVRNADRVARFVAENPEYAQTLELPEIMRAKAELGIYPGTKGHGGLVNRMAPGVGLGASAAMAMAGEHGPRALLPVAAGFAAHNWPAMMGRFAYRPSLDMATMLHGVPGAKVPSTPASMPGFMADYAEAIARARREQEKR